MTNRTQKLGQAASCLLCAAVTWEYPADLYGTEFSGGRISGPLLDMYDIGRVLFVLALLLTFVFPRVAATMALAASVISLPPFLYFAAPGPFRWVVRGNYKIPLRANFEWNNWTIAGIVTLVVAMCVCLRSFRSINRAVQTPAP